MWRMLFLQNTLCVQWWDSGQWSFHISQKVQCRGNISFSTVDMQQLMQFLCLPHQPIALYFLFFLAINWTQTYRQWPWSGPWNTRQRPWVWMGYFSEGTLVPDIIEQSLHWPEGSSQGQDMKKKFLCFLKPSPLGSLLYSITWTFWYNLWSQSIEY